MIQKRILVIEADSILRDYICEVLREKGHWVDGVDGIGEEVHLIQESYDLVLSDIQKPFSRQQLEVRLRRLEGGRRWLLSGASY